ncbi:YajQ family cyclic di-GMP-binding protein [Legionella yabuuchiae]|uniref:YajQ family cyclic di-GMP-binding protein n=1 Tax=Legionella yabuuchiae TaxID=376727 RepID=UPI0010542634|nr:YajQ family cyclic di-GMP-binding protein [Legionella yabuuchiae]
MPSFDVVSETNELELRNAVENAQREISNRFDFRGVDAEIKLEDLKVTLTSESEFQVRQMEDIFRTHCAKRSVDTGGVDVDDKPVHSGKTHTLAMTFKQGIDQPTAKNIVKLLKDNKLKVQASIQGDKVRVTGKKRDDLQEAIAVLKKSDIELPLQFNNFRD